MSDEEDFLENEVWVQIDESYYYVSSHGRIKSMYLNIERIIKCNIGKRGYPVFNMRINGKTYLKTVHRLVAKYFVENPENKPQVNHIDGNKQNNYYKNLEWVTNRENALHAREHGLHTSDGQKRTAQYNMNGDLLCIYSSATEASKATGISRGQICKVCSQIPKHKTAGGYIWRYI